MTDDTPRHLDGDPVVPYTEDDMLTQRLEAAKSLTRYLVTIQIGWVLSYYQVESDHKRNAIGLALALLDDQFPSEADRNIDLITCTIIPEPDEP